MSEETIESTSSTSTPALATYKTNSCGRKLRVKGPATAEDYDKAAGKVGSCVEDAAFATIAWNWLPDIQGKFVDELIAKHGYPARTVDAAATQKAKDRAAKPENVKDVYEKDTAYIKRVYAEKVVTPDDAGDKESVKAAKELTDAEHAKLDAIWQSLADANPLDVKPSERTSIPTQFLEAADVNLGKPEERRERQIAKWLGKVPSYELLRDSNGLPDRKSLGGLIQAAFYADQDED